MEITKPQTLMGHLSQMYAALTHNISEDSLRKIGQTIPVVKIVTGDSDYLVRPASSYRLKSYMPDAELQVWQHTGHALHVQWPMRYFKLLQDTIEEARSKKQESALFTLV
jgi:hypothetical protein